MGGVLHLLAAIACFTNALPILAQSVLCLAIIGNFVSFTGQAKKHTYTLKHTDTSGWQLARQDAFEAIEILPTTVITTLLILLAVREHHSGKTKTLLILTDALPKDAFRKLTVRLKASFSKPSRQTTTIDKI